MEHLKTFLKTRWDIVLGIPLGIIVLGSICSVFVLQLCQHFITNALIINFQDNIDFNDTTIFITFLLIFAYLVIRLCLNIRYNMVVDKRFIIAISISTIVYSLYRFNLIPHKDWYFVNICKGIKYYDAVYIIFAAYISGFNNKLTIKLVECTKKITDKLRSLYTNSNTKDIPRINNNDTSINIPNEDKLKFYLNVKFLLNKIIKGKDYYKDRAMCIGIPAPWGNGKTSYLNLLEYAVKEDDKSPDCYNKAIIVKFNPWFSSNSDRMVQDFMTTLSDTLNKYNPNISSKLIHYSKILSKAQLGWFSILIDMCFNNKENAIEKQFTEISKCCSEITKPIIIFIDDIDRLQPDEIMGVLQLVRNTANFKNTIFIVPYDRDYINNALTTVHASSKYLEKIFTHPHYLPPLTQEKMKPLLYDIIAAAVIIVNEEEKESLRMFLEYINDNFNIRSAKRFSDQLAASQSRLISLGLKDMYLFDFLIIEYIKFEYYDLYKIISDASKSFIDNDKWMISDKEYIKIGDLTNREYYENNIDPITKNIIDKELGLILLNLIFDRNKQDEHPYRLMCPDIFRMYFEKPQNT